jgi:Family of unknown function (DUF6152)
VRHSVRPGSGLAFSLSMAGLLIAAASFLAVPARAHHTFSVEYDASKCSDMTGTLTKVDWQNPHVYFYVDLKDADNQVSSWSFEAVSVAYLKRSGIQRQDFENNFGKIVTVRACLGKSASGKRAAAETLKMPDGRTLRVGNDVEHGQN